MLVVDKLFEGLLQVLEDAVVGSLNLVVIHGNTCLQLLCLHKGRAADEQTPYEEQDSLHHSLKQCFKCVNNVFGHLSFRLLIVGPLALS